MNKRTLSGLATALLIVLPACASQRPSLYSNEHLMRVGPSVAERDIDQCVQQAERAREGGENLAESAAVSTAGSAAIGAAAGADFSDPISRRRPTRDWLTAAFARKVTNPSGSSYRVSSKSISESFWRGPNVGRKRSQVLANKVT
jgi:hypothetical protein